MKKSRSFQNGALTYMEVAQRVLSGYGQSGVTDHATGGACIPEFLLQYEESDWVFLRRLASHFGTYLLADATDACGKVYFGIPEISYGTVLDRQDYTMEKDMLHYARVLEKRVCFPRRLPAGM